MLFKSYLHGRAVSRYPAIVSTLALVFSLAALCLGGAAATGVFVTSKQIRNGTILSQDIHSGGVKSTDIANGTVSTGDIGTGQVTPQDVTMPAPDQMQDSDVASVTTPSDAGFVLVDSIGNYDKQDPTSELEVDWTGTVATGFSGCVFQIRVDGAASQVGGGEVYAANAASGMSVSATALFDGLAAGTHSIEVWARTVTGVGSPCTVGPASAGIGQTFVVSEQVI